MGMKLVTAITTCAVLVGMTTGLACADPCGMVPPIYTGPGAPITRIGAQKTYVFYSGGVETLVLRPGFSGKVDQFGMLIPFPSVPAIRKVPDHIFPHVAAAIDPPEIVVDLNFRRHRSSRLSGRGGGPAADKKAEGKLRFNEVKVLKQEAVGMYEVAVLAAGSSQALKKWLDDHKYRYPDGMDKPCQQYVDASWCFVAVKTKVGQKKGVEPKPGQRKVNGNLPSGATFDGHVQAMGFRFRTPKLVVPMRLSAFNAGRLRNIVYLLTDSPRRIRSIPEEYVVRQITGKDLLSHVTDPLPLRIIGGTEADIPDWRRKTLAKERDPKPKNGAARELFATDLLAATQDKLSHPHEEAEKVLLAIGERFGLRGTAVDKLNGASLSADREKTVAKSLANLKDLSLTVVDGDFPREVLARQNLAFDDYRMPAKRNSPEHYDAKVSGPTGRKQGIRKLGALAPNPASGGAAGSAWLLSALGLSALGLGIVLVGRGRRGRLLAITALVATGVSLGTATAQDEDKTPSDRELISHLADKEKAEAAIKALVERGKKVIPLLNGIALEGNDVAQRGWAIVAMSEIGGSDVDEMLLKIHANAKQPMLVRTWAAAGRVAMSKSAEALIEKAALVQQFPALGRPIGMRLIEQLSDENSKASAEEILGVTLKVPNLRQALAPAILALVAEKLAGVLVNASDQNVRRQAAAYLGTLAAKGDKSVAREVIKVYTFDPKTKEVAWLGGPLFLPGLRWDKENARALVGNLVAWHLWCDRNGKSSEQNQIYNNLRSISLARVAGYQVPQNNTVAWLQSWGKAVGKAEIERILKEQGVEKDPKYAGVLDGLQ